MDIVIICNGSVAEFMSGGVADSMCGGYFFNNNATPSVYL